MFAPEAFVTQLLVSPIPWTVDGGLNAANVPGIEGGRGGHEVVGDVTAKAAVGICACQVTSRLKEGEPLVCELFVHFCDLAGAANDSRPRGMMADDFCMDGVIPFLLYGPVHAF